MKNKPPRPLLVRALEFVSNKKTALDLGAGPLNDSRFLLQQGFEQVIAIDKEDISDITGEFDEKKFSYRKTALEEFEFPFDFFDLVNAQFILPFIEKNTLSKIISDIKTSLKPDGVFVGQFFGPKDDWTNNPDVNSLSRNEVEKLLSTFKIIFLKEVEKDELTALGEKKHWHIFHFIVASSGD